MEYVILLEHLELISLTYINIFGCIISYLEE